MTATETDFGWLGWFSAFGFLIMGLLALLDATTVVAWPLPVGVTAGIAALAGVGTVLLWAGNDPSADTESAET